MRYMLHETQSIELRARQGYLYDIFHLYFLPANPEGSYIPLIPVGDTGADILFITGHTHHVKHFLDTMSSHIPEKHIVITSCFGEAFKSYSRKKAIYIPKTQHDFCQLRDGCPFGFEFDISDAEINLYNAKGAIMERIATAYDRL